MPCRHFTWHAYGSWFPDRPEGYVHWSRGLQPPEVALATRYREQQKESTAVLAEKYQLAVIDELRKAALLQRFRLHFVACETSHLHVLSSWHDDRSWKKLRRSIRRSISQRLMGMLRRTWLAREEDCRRVEDQEHFDYLIGQYLPSHSGWKWCEGRGLFQ